MEWLLHFRVFMGISYLICLLIPGGLLVIWQIIERETYATISKLQSIV